MVDFISDPYAAPPPPPSKSADPPEQELGHVENAGRSNAGSQDCAGGQPRRITATRLAELQWLATQWKGTAAGVALGEALAELELALAEANS